MIRTWRLDGPGQTLALVSRAARLPEICYWGPALPAGEDLAMLAEAARRDVTGGMLDQNPEISICPEASQTFPGQPGLILSRADGHPIAPALRYATDDSRDNDLALIFVDQAHEITYTARFALDAETGMITASARIDTARPVRLHWLAAPVFPGPDLADEMIEFSGRWCGEFQEKRVAWRPGARLRDNPTGRTGHEHFPGLILPQRGATNGHGQAAAFHYGYSGGHRMLAEELPDGRRQVQFGHATHGAPDPGTTFETAKLYAARSDRGLNGCAVAFQRHLRDRIVTFPDPDRPRPVHYNCWEAVYFDHKLDELQDIATRAAQLGAERFVLDDGWFGRRDDDTSSLGDWWVDARKYPDGLAPLIGHVRGLGMGFGLWFEPEMINPDSDIFRAHPDWALGPEDQIPGRQQRVLDMARAEVREYLFDKIDAILAAHDIEYIKWDHNRVLPAPDARQAAGTMLVLQRLRRAHPMVEIESCASGGGRIDFGILEHCQRVWLSDSNDALERVKIQHGAALFLPLAVTGSHVGPRRCHTSGRDFDIRFRAWVAAARHMGFEMDPRELTEDEAAILSEVTAWWKDNRAWMGRADILRLDTADPAVMAEQHLARDGARFVAFAAQIAVSDQILPRPLCLTGLDAAARYCVTLRNRADAVGLSRGDPVLKSGPVTLSGQALMQGGLALPWGFPDRVWVLEGQRLP